MLPKDARALVRQPYPIALPSEMSVTMVTTANNLEGFRIVQNLGVVRGIVVRSRSVVGSIGAAFQMLIGGNITILTQLCEESREEAFRIMLAHAAAVRANAIVGMRYDATEIAQGATEVLAYGTAVTVESLARSEYRGADGHSP